MYLNNLAAQPIYNFASKPAQAICIPVNIVIAQSDNRKVLEYDLDLGISNQLLKNANICGVYVDTGNFRISVNTIQIQDTEQTLRIGPTHIQGYFPLLNFDITKARITISTGTITTNVNIQFIFTNVPVFPYYISGLS